MGKWIVSLVDTSKLAGWVRAGVAGIITLLASKYLAGTVFGGILSPDIVNTVAVLAGTAVAGIWQQIAKKLDPDYSKPSP